MGSSSGSLALAVIGLLFVWIAVMAGLFEYVRASLPAGTVRRGIIYGIVMWGISCLFFEPDSTNALHEPYRLVMLELSLEAIGMVLVGLTLSATPGRRLTSLTPIHRTS
ncbi:MAG: hypothetical protein R2849_04570 [Thermomicrobiales bacterium]